jgi:hypothetical protein
MQDDIHSDYCYMYNWYLLSLQPYIIHTTQVSYILYIALPLTKPNSTYLAPSSCDGNVHLSPRLLVNCPFLSPIAPAYPSPSNFHPFWIFPGPNVLLIRTHPNPFPSERNSTSRNFSTSPPLHPPG